MHGENKNQTEWVENNMKKLINRIQNIIESFNALLLLLLSLTLFISVVARYIFGFPIPEITIIQKFSVAWLVFMGSSIAIKEKQHLEIDIFSEYLSPKHVKVKNIIVYILTLIAIVFLLFVGISAWKAGFKRTELIPVRFLSTRFSLGYYYSSILIGSFFMFVFHLMNSKELFLSKGQEESKK